MSASVTYYESYWVGTLGGDSGKNWFYIVNSPTTYGVNLRADSYFIASMIEEYKVSCMQSNVSIVTIGTNPDCEQVMFNVDNWNLESSSTTFDLTKSLSVWDLDLEFVRFASYCQSGLEAI